MDKIDRPDIEEYKSLAGDILVYFSNLEADNIDRPEIEKYFDLAGDIFAYISVLEVQNEAMRQTLSDWEVLIGKERERNNDLIDKLIKVNQPGNITDFVKIDKPGQIKINE